MTDPTKEPALGASSTAPRVVWLVLAAIAIAIQLMLLYGFFVMGLGWGGVWWYATLLQAAVGLAVAIIALIRKKPMYALLVPLASMGLMLLFLQLDRGMAAKICSPEVVGAANELGPIPGFTEPPEFMPELGKGCVSRFNSPRPADEVIEHYRQAGTRKGWTLADPQPEGHAVLQKKGLTIDVWPNTRDDRGMYVMRVYR